MKAEQAIFTSLARAHHAGYHLVARSPGLARDEADELAHCCPSHDSLVVDAANRCSLNVHRLATGRRVLSRTCLGAPEYSGRGGRQVYTHALVLEAADLAPATLWPFPLYRDALALGLLHYRADPPASLPVATLGCLHHDPSENSEPGLDVDTPAIVRELSAGRTIILPCPGDRIHAMMRLLQRLPPDLVRDLAFSTSLLHSPSRPFRLCLTCSRTASSSEAVLHNPLLERAAPGSRRIPGA